MHRTSIWLASAAIAVSLLVASFGLAGESGGLRLSTFTCDATPPPGGHPLIWVTSVETVETPLLAKGVVLDDGQRRYVLCSLDWCGLCNSSYDLFRNKIAAAAGIEPAQVAVHSVHQHTAPYTDGDAQRLLDNQKEPPAYVDFQFLNEVTDRLADSVRESLARFEAFDRVGTGQAKVDRVASTRRIPTEGGKVRSRMSSCNDPELIALTEGVIDPMVKTITFARGEKPLVRLHYYATHPQSFYGDPRACYDVPGFARERLQEKEGVFQIYFTGCSGDVAMGKYNDRTPRARDELTDRLYAGMAASAAATRLVPAKELRWRTLSLALPARTDPGYTIEENRARMENPKGNVVTRIRAATRVAYALRSERPIDLSVLEIGDVSMLHLPGESMVEFQLFAQRIKPNAFVAVAAYGDVGPGYICTERSFSEGGYEPTASRVAPHSEGLFKKAIRELLQADPSLN